jgi:hypothetical protein
MATQTVDLGKSGEFQIHKGKLHHLLNIPEDQHIPLERLHEALHSDNPEIVKSARAALGFRAMEHSRDTLGVQSFDQAMVFSLDGLKPRTKIQPPAGMPWDINGEPCGYFKSEVLRASEMVDANGITHDVPAQRIDRILLDFNRAKTLGHRPHIPPTHEDAGDGSKNLGFVVDAVKEGDSLYQIEQFIGTDAITAASRNGTSIGTMLNARLQDGSTISELWDHSACTPCPQLGIKSDIPLAASRTRVVPLCLQFNRGLQMANITDEHVGALREIMGQDAPPDLSKENAMDHAIKHIKKCKGMMYSRQPTARELHYLGKQLDTVCKTRITAGVPKALVDGMLLKFAGKDFKIEGLSLSRKVEEADGELVGKLELAADVIGLLEPTTQISGLTPAKDEMQMASKSEFDGSADDPQMKLILARQK